MSVTFNDLPASFGSFQQTSLPQDVKAQYGFQVVNGPLESFISEQLLDLIGRSRLLMRIFLVPNSMKQPSSGPLLF